MSHYRVAVWSVVLLAGLSASARAAETWAELDPKRIDELAAMLPERPAAFGRPVTDRAAWDALGKRRVFGDQVASAEKLLALPFPAWDDALYLDFSKTGKRPPGEAMLMRRSRWLYPLVIAECLENKGRFVPRINMVLKEYTQEKTWTLPAHDRSLNCFNGKAYEVDLHAAMFARDLGETLYLLGEKIEPEVRTNLLAALETRIFAPLRQSLSKGGRSNWWLHADHNWNTVCLSGSLGAALAVLPDRHDRAVFAAMAEHYSKNYMIGFKEDGYCVEGLGYWNFGFGNYVMLREQLMQATGGKLDLFSDPKVSNVAMFGLRIGIINNVAPAFGDCRFGSKPTLQLLRYCNQVLGLGLSGFAGPQPVRGGSLADACMDAFPNSADQSKPAAASNLIGVRSYFDKVGVLVCRPADGGTCRMGVAIKAGGNGNHSHNDIGSFVVAVGNEQPVGEPGGPHAYEAKTFGSARWTYKLLNSFGHPVPVIAGKLQRDATKVHPKVLQTKFTDNVDEISIDMTPAYPVPELKKLVRTLKYDRSGSGMVTVEDAFEFSVPSAFEESLPTHGRWKQVGARTIVFSLGKETVAAEIQTPGEFEAASEVIEENAPPFIRVGIRLKQPVTAGVVRMVFRTGAN